MLWQRRGVTDAGKYITVTDLLAKKRPQQPPPTLLPYIAAQKHRVALE